MHPKSIFRRVRSGESHRRNWVLQFSGLSLSVAIALTLLSDGANIAFAQNPKAQHQDNANNEGPAPRGKYIVEGVARCAQCHTPLDSQGNPDPARWLQGAPIRWVPANPDSNWPLSAPRIGGNPLPASDEDMVKLLTTGIWTNGEHLRSPMPQFRMDRTDAEAVVAYLKSLTQQP